MSSRHHIDDFMRGRIIGKIKGRKITDVARVFDIAHSIVSRRWNSFKTTEMCSRRHGGSRVEVRPAELDISSYQQGTGAPQLGGWQIGFLLRQEADLPKNCCQTFEGRELTP
ncbi:hypothetical protein TNCV_178091 [Trichonephila clavipes]|nr:hypothetical protein TNCV_178091 [Trichonephila clavipes]